jgi:hypothetical protein
MENKGSGAKMSRGKQLKFILFTLVFLALIIVLLFELGLYIAGYESSYSRMQHFSTTQANWWTCDSINGPRYVKGKAGPADSLFLKNEAWYYNRLKIINSQGYHDKDEFSEIPGNSDSLKVLVAGDSFTWGASSDVDSSYVEVMERDLGKISPALVWNTGIPGTGTNHAIFTTKKFLPKQKSNIIVLGFYTGNDFSDNLIPFSRMIFTEQASSFNLWDYDRNFMPFEISKSEAVKKATGSYPAEELSLVQNLLSRSRFISFVSVMSTKVMGRFSGNKEKTREQEYMMTSKYLKELNEYSKANHAELIVMVIPTVLDIKEKGPDYQKVIRILKELSIPYVETVELYSEKDYVNNVNGHWNNRGHILAGHALSKYLLVHIGSKQKTGAH